MRARNIKPGFFTNEQLAEVDMTSRLLFIGLWCYADREGRFEWRVKKIKAVIFPYDNVDVEQCLCNLLSLHLITRNDNVGYIPCFLKHQHPHPHEVKSTLPENPNKNNVIATTDNVMTCQADSLIPDSLIKLPTTATRTENIFIECFAQNASRLKELYPHADYEAERETCIAHYRTSKPPIDCYPVILKWFQRIPKPKTAAKVLSITFEQQKMDNTKRAMMEFLEEGGNDRTGQKAICNDDGRAVSSIPLRLQ